MKATPLLHRGPVIFLLLLAPFLLNDFSNIYVESFPVWLSIDYVVTKLLPLTFLGYLLVKKVIIPEDMGLKMPGKADFVVYTLVLTAGGLLLDQIGWRLLDTMLPNTRMGSIPLDTDSSWYVFDLYVGLALVALVEEIVFRGLFYTLLRRVIPSLPVVFLLCSLVFGLIHWSLGLAAIVSTALIGALFLLVMWRTGSVLPAIIAHFVVNYVDFSGMNPLGIS
jgi:membrane protease YdiL (CAAX protease family)